MYFTAVRFTDALGFEIVSHAGSVLFEAGPTGGQVVVIVVLFFRSQVTEVLLRATSYFFITPHL